MPRHIAFLRAINVGGRVVTMNVLRTLFETIGFAGVETFIASGNVIFESRSIDRGALERKIEQALEKALGYEVTTFVRTPAEVVAIARDHPFPETRLASAAALNVGLLKEPLSAEARQTLARLQTDLDDLRASRSEIYWLCQKKQSGSTISNMVLEKALRVRTTLRGMRTMAKLSAKYPA